MLVQYLLLLLLLTAGQVSFCSGKSPTGVWSDEVDQEVRRYNQYKAARLQGIEPFAESHKHISMSKDVD